MGVKLQCYPTGKETFQEANDILEMDMARLCCSGTDSDLTDTEITQPAILTCSIAALRILSARYSMLDARYSMEKSSIQHPVSSIQYPACPPSATAGLSVGEYSALVASEVLSFPDSLKLVKERGRLMAKAADANPGTMAAILGFADNAVVESLCEEASAYGVVRPANYNCPGQVVISGEEKAVQRAMELAKKAGARRCVTLNVSGAFHSPLMRSAQLGLRKALNSVSFSNPEIPFIANVTGDYVEEPEEIREMLALQLSSPIQWEASVRRMIDDGITIFVEIGPGKIIASLVHRIYRQAFQAFGKSLSKNRGMGDFPHEKSLNGRRPSPAEVKISSTDDLFKLLEKA